jgi:phosphatidylserine/phosphatidylglycerophosphate/cardiolipin synthase-like enzyme
VCYDTVAKLPLHIHETRIFFDGHVDGVEATWHRVDAIDASLKCGHRPVSFLGDGAAWCSVST